MIIWIIGKSGSGKSYYAKKILKYFKNKKVFWLDGDEFRNFLSSNLGYSLKDRKQNSVNIQNFCKYLDSKGYVVICSILSIFKNHQKKNRSIFSKYVQIYLKANQEILEKRNNKNIYTKRKNVVSKDLRFPTPYKSHLVLHNDFSKKNLKKNISKIIKFLNKWTISYF